jgi:hypothetical protein
VEDLTWWAEILVQKPGARLTRRERRHGLGTLWQEVVWKLTHVYRGHREFFAALAWFIACGNEVILLKGNHDVELHWPQVHDGHFPHVLTDVYRDLCGGGAVGPAFDDYPPEMLKGLPDPPSFETLLPQRFTFEDWFYYERDLVYVEHGNQYEPADSSVYFLAPVMPSDPKRIELPWGAFMVRYFYNKIVAIHPFAVNVKPEERIIHWMIQHDLFRILGIVVAELPDILRALGRAVKQGFRGSWIWGDHSIIGLIPLLIYDLVQFFTRGMGQAEQRLSAEQCRRRTEIARRYNGAGVTPGSGVQRLAGKYGLLARFLLHLGALAVILCLLLLGGGGLFGWAGTTWLVVPLIISGAVAGLGAVWSLGLAGANGRHSLGQILLQLGGVGAIAGLLAALFLGGVLNWTFGDSLLAVAIPSFAAILGGGLIYTAGSEMRAVAPQLFRRGWPAKTLRSGASLLVELGLLSTGVGAYYLFGPVQTASAVAWLLAAVALFTCSWVGGRLHALYINRRWLNRLIERWLGDLQRRIRTWATVIVALLVVAIFLGPIAWVVREVVRLLFEQDDKAKSILHFADQAYDFMTTQQVLGMPILLFLLLSMGGAILLQTAFRWLIERGRQGQLHRHVSSMPLQSWTANVYRKGLGSSSVTAPASVVAEQLEEIQELARAEQRRWLGSLLGLLTLLLPLIALVLLAIAIVGGAAAFLNAVNPLLAVVEPLKALGVTVLFGFAFWLVRQIGASTQRHDPASGFGDLFYRMAVGIADILDAAGAGSGLGQPRYFVFGHDHWADSQPLTAHRGQHSGSGQQWYVNSGTWLRGYVEEQRRQEVNENHSTFVQIIPGLSDNEAPRVLRWNDSANQPEHIVRRQEPRSAGELMWDRWEERSLWVLLWGLLLAALWGLAPGAMTRPLSPIAWAFGLWLFSGILVGLGRVFRR